VIFSLVFFAIFATSERLTARKRQLEADNVEQFRVFSNPELNSSLLRVRPGCVLVGVRNPHNLAYLRNVLTKTDTTRQDVVVMTVRLYHREHSFSGNTTYEAKQVFDAYEQELFTAVVGIAEKEGKPVSLLVAPGSNVFDTILMTAQRLEAAHVVCGFSEKLSQDQQGKLTGDAWERLPEPKPRIVLQLINRDGTTTEYRLGPHTPRLREVDLALLHNIWLELTLDPELSGLHHYHIVSVALEDLNSSLHSVRREKLLTRFADELHIAGGKLRL